MCVHSCGNSFCKGLKTGQTKFRGKGGHQASVDKKTRYGYIKKQGSGDR